MVDFARTVARTLPLVLLRVDLRMRAVAAQWAARTQPRAEAVSRCPGWAPPRDERPEWAPESASSPDATNLMRRNARPVILSFRAKILAMGRLDEESSSCSQKLRADLMRKGTPSMGGGLSRPFRAPRFDWLLSQGIGLQASALGWILVARWATGRTS